MALLILGLVIFIGTHSFTMMRAQRAAAIARLGENGYKGIYSLLAVLGLVLIWIGFGQYRADGYIQIWWPPIWTQHLSTFPPLFASVLLPAAYMPGYIKAKGEAPDARGGPRSGPSQTPSRPMTISLDHSLSA